MLLMRSDDRRRKLPVEALDNVRRPLDPVVQQGRLLHQRRIVKEHAHGSSLEVKRLSRLRRARRMCGACPQTERAATQAMTMRAKPARFIDCSRHAAFESVTALSARGPLTKTLPGMK